MADHTKTVTNQVEVFGGGSASYFDAYNWGEFYWGDGTAPMRINFGRNFGNSLTLSHDMGALYLRDSANWTYNFHDNVTNAADRHEPTWTQVTRSSTV